MPKSGSTAKRKFLSPAEKIRKAAEQDYKCHQCRKVLPSTWQVDHIRPLHKGGDNTWPNLQIICPNCHADKTQVEAINRGGDPHPHFRTFSPDNSPPPRRRWLFCPCVRRRP